MKTGNFKTQKQEILKQIEKNLSLKSDDVKFAGWSNAHGLSIYFIIDGIKCRFSDHSTTNRFRVMEEMHFRLPFQVKMARGGVKKECYNDNIYPFSHLQQLIKKVS